MRIAGIEKESFVDGEGIRFAVFVQGCSRHCTGCHNQITWDHSKGRDMEIEDIVKEFDKNPLLNGITITGGEPFEQAKGCAELAKMIKAKNKNVWCYTGFKLEELVRKKDPDINKLLDNVDVLVDGPYKEELRDLDIEFRGSLNQRILHLDKRRERREKNYGVLL